MFGTTPFGQFSRSLDCDAHVMFCNALNVMSTEWPLPDFFVFPFVARRVTQ